MNDERTSQNTEWAEAAAPFLSVVIPTYNRAASLAVTLGAIEWQEPVPGGFEVVVVSDGSTDDTTAILADFSRRASFPVRPIRQENAGPARARNRGVREARGAIIVFIDDDVEPVPGFLRTHAAHHADDEHTVVIGPMSPDPARTREEPVWIAWEHQMLQKQYRAFADGIWVGAGPNHFYTGNASVRREHVLEVGGFDEEFKRQEDVELAYRMERECGTHFIFDASADALHRPSRTFESWLRVPYAYGSLDVIRAQRGDAPWRVVWKSYHGRSPATRLLARTVLRWPGLSAPLRALLLRAAMAAYSLPATAAKRAGVHALSALYNIRYLEGARDEMGSWAALRTLLGTPQMIPPEEMPQGKKSGRVKQGSSSVGA
jgi:glycosyltransferase involved in cell wall biosynthesis